mmetsp:Transcript_117441/g.262355  ORF Transcript_117441/g.262355 Transcript_117441/m.262355 type:complete len:222 (-) Transcript_117441:189-854(-)
MQLQHRRLSSGGPSPQCLDLGLFLRELGPHLRQLRLHLGQRARLHAGDLHSLLARSPGGLDTACVHTVDISLNAVKAASQGRRGREVPVALATRQCHPHVGAVPRQDAPSKGAAVLVLLLLHHRDALANLNRAQLLAAFRCVCGVHTHRASVALPHEPLEIGDREHIFPRGDVGEDGNGLLLSESHVLAVDKLGQAGKEGREVLRLADTAAVLGEAGEKGL